MTFGQPGTRAVPLCVFAAVCAIAIWLSYPSRPAPRVITAVAFSPDGRYLAAGLRTGEIVVWRVGAWTRAAAFRDPDAGLNALAFRPDSRVLASAGRSLRLWAERDWRLALTLGRPGAVYGTARFRGDSAMLATVNAAEQIQLWDPGTGALVRTLCCMALYGDVAFSPDGSILAAAGHWPRLWSVATGRELRRFVHTRNPTFGAVAFRPDGRVLATGSQDGMARLWNAETGGALASAQTRRAYIETIAFHPNGRLVAYGSREGPVWLWDTATGMERGLAGHSGSNVAFSADGNWLAFGGPGAGLHVWSTTDRREAITLSVRD